jgi:formate dehydrogenase major subunit
MENVHVTIDGREINVPADWTVLDAAREAGVEIPTLCYHPELKPFNSCLLCVVEIEGGGRPALACGTQVRDGMVITSRSDLIKETRRIALELLLSEHCGDCFGPCHLTCPANCDIPGFVHAIARGDHAEANRIIKRDIPLPVALGCVCPAPCEEECRRNRLEDPLAIRVLKRFAGEQDLKSDQPYLPEVAPDTGYKVAIVGAGPAGLSAAYYLRQMGHAVTIFEARAEAGGMLRYGIPAYRMPREKLASEINTITDLGVDIQYNTAIGCDVSFEDLRKNYDAVFLGIGAQNSRPMNIPGEDNEGVWGGVEFLACVNDDSEVIDTEGRVADVGQHIVVIGGGNTAIDAARTSVRLGADVQVIYRRSRQEMPAWDIEVDAAEEEGVEFHFLASPIGVQETEDGLKITNIRMELGPPDASGRRRPIPIEGSEFVVACDTFIMAIGQVVDTDCVVDTGVAFTRWGTIDADPWTTQTTLPDVFAGGDGVTGPDIAVEAVGAGHRAAVSIDQYLRGEAVVGPEEMWSATMGKLDEVTEARFADVEKVERADMPELPVAERVSTFDEVELGLTEEMAVKEAGRCLECECAAIDDCDLRRYAIEYGADPERFTGARREYKLDDSHEALMREPGKCILCGLCVRMCRDVKGLNVFNFANRGFAATVEPYFGLSLAETTCDGCLKCVEVCSTGALIAREGAAEALEEKLETAAA